MTFHVRQIILDTETTGLDPTQGHRLTEIGCIEMIDRRATGQTFQTYLNPEREIDEGASQITGLSLSFLKDKPKFSEIAKDFLDFLWVDGTELIIHNAPFDLSFLNHELNLLSHPKIPLEQFMVVIDTLKIARRLHPGKQNNLDALCKRYNIKNTDRKYHGALLDARLLMRVYLAMTSGQSELHLHASDGLHIRTTNKLDLESCIRAYQRDPDFVLPIIYADLEEVKLHEAWIKKLCQ